MNRYLAIIFALAVTMKFIRLVTLNEIKKFGAKIISADVKIKCDDNIGWSFNIYALIKNIHHLSHFKLTWRCSRLFLIPQTYDAACATQTWRTGDVWTRCPWWCPSPRAAAAWWWMDRRTPGARAVRSAPPWPTPSSPRSARMAKALTETARVSSWSIRLLIGCSFSEDG